MSLLDAHSEWKPQREQISDRIFIFSSFFLCLFQCVFQDVSDFYGELLLLYCIRLLDERTATTRTRMTQVFSNDGVTCLSVVESRIDMDGEIVQSGTTDNQMPDLHL